MKSLGRNDDCGSLSSNDDKESKQSYDDFDDTDLVTDQNLLVHRWRYTGFYGVLMI